MRFFGTLKDYIFYGQKKVSFDLAHYLTLFVVLFWPKTTQEIKSISWPKAWVNPFGKMRYLGLSKIEFFMAKKGFFSIYNIIKHYF